jgi:tRNA G18 (ribose-2'-O)-methylase SpoU
MGIVTIDSFEDPRLEPFRNLKATNETRYSGRFVAEGEKLARRILASDFRLHALLVSRRNLPSLTDVVDAAQACCDVLVIPDEWVERLVGFNFHRGVLACAYRKSSPDLLDLCRRRIGRLTLVVCPNIQDPENLGTILRTSCALGVDGVVIGRDCCDPFSRRVLRVSMGAAFRIPIVENGDLASQLRSIRCQFQVALCAAVADASGVPFDQSPRPERLALVVGGEGHGLSAEWLELCDHRVTIPMRPGTDSLNVAVATGILAYHLTR